MKIICPHCGAEYLPAEIFYPNHFLGKPKHITKDAFGKLKFYVGNMDLNETYICDYCNTRLHVAAKVSFSVNGPVKSSRHVTTFKKPPLVLKED